MDDTGKPLDDEDDLLRTIRAMVNEEAEREVKRLPPLYTVPGLESEPEPAPAAPAGTPVARAPGPLVLGAMARVSGPAPAGAATGGSPAAPMYDEEALRGIVSDLVRDELDELFGEAFEHRVRQIARREISALISRAQARDEE